MSKLMFAFGANLNVRNMKKRCPNATKLGAFILPDYNLVFRIYADIVPAGGFMVHGGLWNITEECETSLDRFEGVASGFYSKEYFKVGSREVLFYKMRDDPIRPPMKSYADMIRQGYADFNLPLGYLEAHIDTAQFIE